MSETEAKAEAEERKWRAVRAESFALLLLHNPKAALALVNLYADAFAEYARAAANIAELGPIVQHPKTGSPIDNPYLRIRDANARTLKDPRFVRLKTDPLWEAKP
jgi:phage terminase small subunit